MSKQQKHNLFFTLIATLLITVGLVACTQNLSQAQGSQASSVTATVKSRASCGDPDLTDQMVEEANQHYYKGLYYEDSGKYDAAIIELSSAIKCNPNFLLPYLSRGTAYKQEGKADQAFSDFLFITQAKYNYLFDGTTSYVATKIATITTTDEMGYYLYDNTRAHAYTYMADISIDKGAYKDALSDISNAIELDPSDITRYEKRADIQKKLGNKDNAIADYRGALRLDGQTFYLHGVTKTMSLSNEDRHRIGQKLKELGVSP